MGNLKDLLVVTDEDIAIARRHYQKTANDIKIDVAILKEWLRQQPHLPNDEDEGRLERMFLKNKCRLEQTKKKLDSCYSFKVFYPDLLDMYDINSTRMQNVRKSIIFVPMRKLTNKQERVYCFKIINTETFLGLDCFMYVLMMHEFGNTYDYSLSDIHVVDWSGITINAMKTFDATVLHTFATILMGALSGRIATVQFINVPSFIDILIKVIKMVAKPKLFDKIKFNSRIEGIYNAIPKELLPIEYGGKEKSIYQLHEEWGKELQCQVDLLTKISNRKSDESLRIGELEESSLFGTEGSFKKINLD